MRRKTAKHIGLPEFRRRRREMMALMEENSIAILPGAGGKVRNGDVEFHFRQDSDFFYLTGFDEPDAVLALIPGREHDETILFCCERDEDQERWHGRVAGAEGAIEHHGMDDAFPVSDIDDILPGLIEGKSRIYYTMNVDREFDHQMFGWVKLANPDDRAAATSPAEFVHCGPYLHELRLYKSPAEIKLMRLAANATVKGHCRIMERTRAGMMEYELEAELNHEFAMNGARWPAYPSIVGGGVNACVLHYICNDDVLRDGDLVLVDAGGEYENYACDVTRTFPVNGKFSNPQAEVYDLVLAAQQAAIAEVQPGNAWHRPHDVAVKVITEGLVSLGILQGDLEALLAGQAYLPYYMHKTGHWLGLDVHDVGEYQVNGAWRIFAAGMVTTIEPGIYISADLPGAPDRYRGIGIRIEDDVLVTKTGHEVLTEGAPKTIVAIEKLMSGRP